MSECGLYNIAVSVFDLFILGLGCVADSIMGSLQALSWDRCMPLTLPNSDNSLFTTQVNLPVARVDGLPVGLSMIGPAGSDERLLELAEGLQ